MATCRTTVSTSSPQAPAPGPAHPAHTMGVISDLPENLLRDVFSRVGSIRSLFMLAVTCHGWLRRFTDRAFLREMLCPSRRMFQEDDHRARLLGIFVQHSGFDPTDTEMVQLRREQSKSAFAPFFLPRPESPLGLAGPLADGDGTFNHAEPLAARRGIILMRLAPRSTDAEVDCRHLFGICNPVTGGGTHVLPPLNDYGWVRGYAIVTAADGDLDNGTTGRFTFSQLLVITDCDRHRHSAHYYSAATRSWRTRACRCLDADRFSLVGERSAVVHQGAAHWLCIIHDHDHGHVQAQRDNRLYKLSVEVATGSISLTKLPVSGGGGGGRKPLLCVTRDGKLAVASVYDGHMTIWTQPAGAEDGSTTAVASRSRRKRRPQQWPSTSFRIPPAPAVPDPNGAPKWQFKEEEWCNFGQGSILVLYRSGYVFILDLHEKVMKEVVKVTNRSLSPRYRKRVACIPYEMDLVEFFTRQLGGLGRDGLDRSSNPIQRSK